MKVSVEISDDYKPPRAVIYADAMTEEIRKIVDWLGQNDTPLIGQLDERLVVIKPEEVYMIRIESGETIIHTETGKYYSGKRLYETVRPLGRGFMQISKQTIINLSYIKSVEAGFSGTLLLKLKNGLSDYVSRKYLPELKKYLGI